jgi:hypothetical protein
MNDEWTALLEHGLVRFAIGTALTAMASAVWLVVIAFRTNVIWGVGVWFGYPYGAFAFCVQHWKRARCAGIVHFLALFVTLAALGAAAMMELDQTRRKLSVTAVGAIPSPEP